MKTPSNVIEINAPKLMPSVVAGFSTVAGHIELMLLPLIIDLMLWLGPKIKIQQAEKPVMDSMISYLQSTITAETKDQVENTITVLKEFFNTYNLGAAIRTLPVGVPSLLAREVTLASPLKNNIVIEASSSTIALLVLLGLTLLGFFLGTLYFNALARYTVTPVLPNSVRKIMLQFGQNLVTALILIALILIVVIPGLALLMTASLINPAVGQFLLMAALFVLMWLSVPLVFAPHGIFVLNQKAYPSMLLSIRMVRYFLPGAGMFIMTCALISEGLNMIWSIPDASSWFTLFGIFGHAFVVTALLAASFIYYRGGLKWMQESIQNISDPNVKANLGGPFGSK